MKTLALTLSLFFVVSQNAQQKNIFTKSVQIENFIPFIVDNFQKDLDSIKNHNITFLLPVIDSNNLIENNFILKQGFRLLSNRLNEDDKITIIAYSSINGEVLKTTSVKQLNKILYGLNNIDKSISKTVDDGIQLGYDTADANFDEDAINSIVIIRDSKIKAKAVSLIKNKEKRPRNNAVLLTLISLAPEMIKLLKE